MGKRGEMGGIRKSRGEPNIHQAPSITAKERVMSSAHERLHRNRFAEGRRSYSLGRGEREFGIW